MTKEEATSIAQNYLLKKHSFVKISDEADYYPSGNSSAVVEGRATWGIWFPVESRYDFHDILIYVDEETGEAWQFSNGGPTMTSWRSMRSRKNLNR